MNSAYNQQPLDEQSRRLSQFVIGNQQYENKRLFYGISIGPAAFSAIMSKIVGPFIFSKNVITYLDDVFIQSQKKQEIIIVLDKYHQTLLKENVKPAPDKSNFFLTRVKFFGHINEGTTITPLQRNTTPKTRKYLHPSFTIINNLKTKNSLSAGWVELV